MNISQEARDAAALLGLENASLTRTERARMLTGEMDDHYYVQAFQRAIDAAHARGVAEERARVANEWDFFAPLPDAAAIREPDQ